MRCSMRTRTSRTSSRGAVSEDDALPATADGAAAPPTSPPCTNARLASSTRLRNAWASFTPTNTISGPPEDDAVCTFSKLTPQHRAQQSCWYSRSVIFSRGMFLVLVAQQQQPHSGACDATVLCKWGTQHACNTSRHRHSPYQPYEKLSELGVSCRSSVPYDFDTP